LNRPLNICVMLGGPSAEREVSLRSGAAAARALRSLGHNVRELDPAGSSWQLPPETEVVFLALHGTYGEDGGVQARLEELGVPYTGCGPDASRTAFDKVLTKKRCLRERHPHRALRRARRAPAGPAARLDAAGRAQTGAARLQHRAAICGARRAVGRGAGGALRYDTEVLMEEKIQGRETTVGILEDRALPVAGNPRQERRLRLPQQIHRGRGRTYLPRRF
jgi:D-alanine-D-alanine ligase